MPKKCSIIIRTKNEEKWINSCLSAVFNQTYENIEVIIVDNNSLDRTLEKARKFPVYKYVTIEEYLPGDALNIGIKASSGEYIVCLSAHCIPVNNFWLSSLVDAIEEQDDYAGVYGRQEPMSFSRPSDKRDLLTVFGLDKKIQIKDSFFHNANSIIKRELWEKYPFDEVATNIEDRLWAQNMLSIGYRIVYEPLASVYHYHGIHQNGNESRLNGVLSVIEGMSSEYKFGKIEVNNLNIIAVIPVGRLRGDDNSDFLINNIEQYSYTIRAAKKSKYISKVIVSTDDEQVMIGSIKLGAECPFIRPKNLSEDYITTEEVQKYTLEKIEEMGVFPDLIVHLEETFPIRKDGLIDEMIEDLIHFGYDTVIAVKKESGFIWKEDSKEGYELVNNGLMPRLIKNASLIGLKGLCCVTYPSFIRNGSILGDNVGLHVINKSIEAFEVRDEESRNAVSKILFDKE
jgi:rhamnosyltransferase